MEIKKNLFSIIFTTFVLSFMSVSVVAVDVGLCVDAVVTQINPSLVDKGEEFVVGINIENCGDDIPTDVSFQITQMPEDFTVVEDLKTQISQLSYSSSERYISYHMRAKSDATPGVHNIKMRLDYGDGQTYMNRLYDVTVSVKGDEADLELESIFSDPEEVYVGEVNELNLMIKNYGVGVAKNLNVKLDYDLIGVSQVSLGALDFEESKSAGFKFKLDDVGLVEIPVIVSYEDDFGSKEMKTNIKLTVFAKKQILNIASIKSMPVLPKVGDTVEMILRIENFGEKDVNSIRVSVDHPFSGVTESFIGTLESDEDGPSILTFVVDKEGDFEFPVSISYRDEFGEQSFIENIKLSVLPEEESSSSTYIIVFLLVVIALMLWFNFKVKRKKDEIIQQLMGKKAKK